MSASEEFSGAPNRNGVGKDRTNKLSITVSPTFIEILSWNMEQGKHVAQKYEIPLPRPISIGHVKKVFGDHKGEIMEINQYGPPDDFNTPFLKMMEELLGDIFYEYELNTLEMEEKRLHIKAQTHPDYYSVGVGKVKIASCKFLIWLIKSQRPIKVELSGLPERGGVGQDRTNKLSIKVSTTFIEILSWNMEQGKHVAQKYEIPLPRPISFERVKRVFGDHKGEIMEIRNDNGRNSTPFMNMMEELLGDIFYEYDLDSLEKEEKSYHVKGPDFYSVGDGRVKFASCRFLISLVKRPRPIWKLDYENIKRELDECRRQLQATRRLMPRHITLEEEMEQADTRAKQGAVKHRESQEKMRQMYGEETPNLSVAEHVLSAGKRKTKRTKRR